MGLGGQQGGVQTGVMRREQWGGLGGGVGLREFACLVVDPWNGGVE